jgi:hypothetical protein
MHSTLHEASLVAVEKRQSYRGKHQGIPVCKALSVQHEHGRNKVVQHSSILHTFGMMT